ncbi:hypothetical protein COF75_07625 [Bacillus toyonensis]|uniref:hypothetical protein n=1 Tax=Bacillus toyonensis TaxID=155322 RepID=UPI000BFE75BF|nr:hypothetical protein [Bacillus toyonensis]PHD51890.1 hypothetical protein COF75_07625 [Bacillus toyonensis]
MKIETKRYITLQLTFEEAEGLMEAISYGNLQIDVNSRAHELNEAIEDGLNEILSDWSEN